ncbi:MULTISPECIES: hypothetical protein [Actinosynnema]|uniref:Uncharacterized protein n=2 Tax=Actinosynnema TaxID=40566 RepID=C6WP12_ACTMD|nr:MULTISPECIES: hypothetical protein [Actinosynnema]ACU36681.1 hypothetical protein Amir_2748 [Actinosynnema mirum DSM 43827]AXX30143.1 hypothetical protein APASM_2778 [Actinosynnema pretiosum subsp. pretiosum]MCP2092206.1 hypothetical protein [Actinosynnema pretiosum]QUF05694.1 hypothetical protein KCV87_06285 [Actinosynnema pretiosum subsp. pretiosum]
MPWVRQHRRHVPGSWFRTTTVHPHHRRRAGSLPLIPVAIGAVVAILVLLLIIF